LRYLRKRARATEAQAPCSHSTVTTKGRFTTLTPPLTPEREKADGPNTSEYDRGFSDTSDDKRRGSFSARDSSEYCSPVSDVEQELREVKTEDQAELFYTWLSLPRRSHSIDRRCS
jgi:hypothetical protein